MIAAVLAILVPTASAATVPLGSRTFNDACNASAAGDTITVPAGSYGSQTVSCTKAVTFQGQSSPTVAYIAFSSANGPTVDGFTITGGLESKSSKFITVRNSNIYNLVYIEGTTDMLMDHNVHTNAPGGTTWQNGDMLDIYEQTNRPVNQRITVQDSVFHGLRAPTAASHSDALQLCNCSSAGDSQYSKQIKILRNKFYDNECMNIRANPKSEMLIEGNLFGDSVTGISGCGYFALDVYYADATVRYNTFTGSQKIQVDTGADVGQSQTWVGNAGIGMSSSCGAIRGTYANNVWTGQKCGTSDKQVSSLGINSDGTEKSTSPLIDAGNMTTYPATDYAGNARYSGAAPDAGAFEFNSGGTTPPDTTAPDTTINSAPADGTSTSASVSFTATESGSTFECKLDAGAWASCTSPKSYTGLGTGSHTFSVRATDVAGNVDASPAAATWTISAPADTTPPDTTITSAPSNGTSTSASVSFTATESGSTFACKLDSGSWAACTSPKSYTGLAVGSHTVSVRATDAAGNVDATPAAVTWTISAPADTTPPDTTITSAPSDGTSTSASVSFTATESGSTFECQLDGGAWASCTSPKSYTGLAVGSHTVSVRATDAAGNVDATPATASWTISSTPPADTTPPDTTITSAPADGTSTSASVSFTATESGSTFECKLDTGAWAACTSPKSYTGLAVGSHTVSVRATDTAGNVDASPASASWAISSTPPADTTAPTASITAKPASTTTDTSASFAFTGSDDVTAGDDLTWRCKLDKGSYAACSSPKAYTGLAVGSHTFSVRATDAAGNQSTAATATWTVQAPDTTKPAVTITSKPSATVPTLSTSASFAFTGSDDRSAASALTYRCALDGAAATGCTSPATVDGLGLGFHTFTVVAVDEAGNASDPASATWTVVAVPVVDPPKGNGNGNGNGKGNTKSDVTTTPAPTPAPAPALVAPTVALLKPANGTTFSTSLKASATATDDGKVDHVEFWLDGTRFGFDQSAPYAATMSTKKVKTGAHTLVTRAVDDQGLASSVGTAVKRVGGATAARRGTVVQAASTTTDATTTLLGNGPKGRKLAVGLTRCADRKAKVIKKVTLALGATGHAGTAVATGRLCVASVALRK